MTCERCARMDDYRLGTDEQPHAEWLILCEACERELSEDKAADVDLTAQATAYRCYEPVIQARGIRGPMRKRSLR